MNNAPLLAALGIVSLLTSAILRYVIPNAAMGVGLLAALGMVLVAFGLIPNMAKIRNALASSPGTAWLSTVMRAALAIAVIVAVNIIANISRAHLDLTAQSQFALSQQTRETLERLSEPVEATFFFTANTPPQVVAYARDLLAEYQHASARVSVREVDPIANPELARAYHLEETAVAAGVVLFNASRGHALVTAQQIVEAAESAFTSAILVATGQRLPVVYFATGHGELGPDAHYARAAQALERALFDVRELDLRSGAAVPGDAAALLVVGADSPVGVGDVSVLDRYLERGGRLCLLFDPNPDVWVKEFLSAHGVEVRKGTIVDFGSHAVPDELNVLVPADRNAFRLGEVSFPGLAPVRPRLDIPEGYSVATLGMTSSHARIVSDLRSRANSAPQADPQNAFPIGLLVSAARDVHGAVSKEQRLIVIGDTDFASDDHIGDGQNAVLFATLLKWLTAGQSVVSVSAKAMTFRRFLVTPEQARFIGVSSVALLPSLILTVGSLVLWRRHRRRVR